MPSIALYVFESTLLSGFESALLDYLVRNSPVILGSVMVPAAHRPKIGVQIWAQFSLLGAPSALFTLLGITEDSSEVLCFPLAVTF